MDTDLEPVTYPSHLAQSSAPRPDARQHEFPIDAGTGVSTANGSPSETTQFTRLLPVVPNGSALPVSDPHVATENENALDETATRRRRAVTRSQLQTSSETRSQRPSHKSTSFKPRDIRLPAAKGMSLVPASALYFSPVPCYGRQPDQALRAHTGTLVGEKLWVIGGVDKQSCWRGVACFDTESFMWNIIETQGERFPPLRAHTATIVGEKLFIFGGGDGPSYSNDVWMLDTVTHRFSRPIFNPTMPLPPPRRAHTSVLYKHYLVIFGGGNGQTALNDVWALDVSDPNNLSWQEWKTSGDTPQKKGYHTANLIGHKMIIFGGSDGHASFADVHVLNLQTHIWTLVNTDVKHNRLAHTSTQVGPFLFVIGGHNGQAYAQDVLLFDLVTLQWESKTLQGKFPPGRGYHVALLHDARIFISGGYNGEVVFDDFWMLDLSASAYLPQVSNFELQEAADISQKDSYA